MAKETKNTGVFQLDNGCWGYRFVLTVDGKKKAQKRVKDENGNPYKTEKQAAKARSIALGQAQAQINQEPRKKIIRRTVKEVYQEYCKTGRNGKAYTTILKQDSLWSNHLSQKFGNRYVDDISLGEIQDYLEELYYIDGRAYSYVESFLKMFYLIFGQAYSRDYMDVDLYHKFCVNKDTKIHMPKMKVDEDTDIVSFDREQMMKLDQYFKGSNAETAYMLGKYCGVRINECYGLKWSNIDLINGVIHLDRQMQYQDGLIKLVSLKTRNAKRKIYMCKHLRDYFEELSQKRQKDEKELALQREQNQTFIRDIDGSMISSFELVNTLPNGKIQTVNSMKYHSRTIKERLGICFKYHYLRHTFGTRLAEMNTPSHLLCNQMGHGNIQVTQKYYIAVSKDSVQELLSKMESL